MIQPNNEINFSNFNPEIDQRRYAEDLIDTLSELFAMRGVPKHIRSDNGPEFIAHALRRWLGQVGVDAMYIEPGSPWENGYAESFHGRLRDEFLAMEIFEGVRDARALTASWRDEYNAQRPHSSLGYLTPAGFAAACAASASAKASAPAAHAACGEAPCS
jgi:transposase InsO family protein